MILAFTFGDIAIPALVLGITGLIFGILLAVANRFFSVEKDPKEIRIREVLPGANCGGCGFPGCDAFAKAVASGQAPTNGCPVSNSEQHARVAEIMGVDAQAVEPLTTFVRCRGSLENTREKYVYEGIRDCAAAASLADGFKTCRFACLGLGNCTRVCPTGAMTVVNGLATIDQGKCITCGKCIAACPRKIITMVPSSSVSRIQCSAMAKGKEVRDNCEAGCIGCGICAKSCPFEAITLVNDLPVIDYEKCTGCRVCVEKCPRHCIWGNIRERKAAFVVTDLCVGCGLCKKQCKFDAIVGDKLQPHLVDTDKCVGCSQCEKACPKKAIKMINRS